MKYIILRRRHSFVVLRAMYREVSSSSSKVNKIFVRFVAEGFSIGTKRGLIQSSIYVAANPRVPEENV